MKNARFLRMVETTRGIGFLYNLSEPFYGCHHVFLNMDREVHPCSPRGAFPHETIPFLVAGATNNQEVLEDLGYVSE